MKSVTQRRRGRRVQHVCRINDFFATSASLRETNRFLRFLFVLLIPSSLFAQTSIHIKGKVYSAKDSSAIAFAIVKLNNSTIVSQSGLDGSFDLQLPSVNTTYDTIFIFCLGYENDTIPVKKPSDKSLAFYLHPKDLLLGEAYATDYTLKTMLKKVEDNIPDNYPTGAFTMNGFYCQYHKENGKYVRLIESDLDVYHESLGSATSSSQKELIRLKHLRRSINYEENKEEHGDHLVDLLSENPVRYVIGTVLNSKAYEYYRFHIEQTTIDSATGKKNYRLSFISKPGFSEKNERGEILISDSTFAVLYIKIIEERNPDFETERRHSAGPYEWKFINGVFEAHFQQQQDGKYYTTELIKSYLHELVNNRFHTVAYTVEENFHLHYDTQSFTVVTNPSVKKRFHAVTNLYYHKYEYDKGFWNSYQIPGKGISLQEISKDLSFKKPLDEQYIEAGK